MGQWVIILEGEFTLYFLLALFSNFFFFPYDQRATNSCNDTPHFSCLAVVIKGKYILNSVQPQLLQPQSFSCHKDYLDPIVSPSFSTIKNIWWLEIADWLTEWLTDALNTLRTVAFQKDSWLFLSKEPADLLQGRGAVSHQSLSTDNMGKTEWERCVCGRKRGHKDLAVRDPPEFSTSLVAPLRQTNTCRS